MSAILELQIVEKVFETPLAATLTLLVKNGPVAYHAGQFITFIFNDLGPKEIRRSYSISSAPEGNDNYLAITAKKIPNGLVSRYLVDQTSVGMTLFALKPSGKFICPPSKGIARDLIFFGAGSGITPLFSIIRDRLKREPASKLTLVYANSNLKSVIFLEALQRLARQFPERLHIIHLISNLLENVPTSTNVESWNKRFSNQMMEGIVGKYLKHDIRQAQFFLCGPRLFMLKAKSELRVMGVEEKQIHQETFVIIPPLKPDSENFPPATVLLIWAGKTYQFPVKSGQTILEAALNSGIILPYSCRSGICNTCAAECRDGIVKMYTQDGIFTSENTKGQVLTCVGYPLVEKIYLELF